MYRLIDVQYQAISCGTNATVVLPCIGIITLMCVMQYHVVLMPSSCCHVRTLNVHNAVSCGSNVNVMLSCSGQIDILSRDTDVRFTRSQKFATVPQNVLLQVAYP